VRAPSLGRPGARCAACLPLARKVEVGVLGAAVGRAQLVDHVNHPVRLVRRAEHAARLARVVEVRPARAAPAQRFSQCPFRKPLLSLRHARGAATASRCRPDACRGRPRMVRAAAAVRVVPCVQRAASHRARRGQAQGEQGAHHVLHSGNEQRLFIPPPPPMAAPPRPPRPTAGAAALRRTRGTSCCRLSQQPSGGWLFSCSCLFP